MVRWIPIAVNEKPVLRGRKILPEYSAAAVGDAVVLRHFGGGFGGLAVALTSIPFASAAQAAAWIEDNRIAFTYDAALPEA